MAEKKYYGRCRRCAKTVGIEGGMMSVTKPHVPDDKRKRPFVPRLLYKGTCPECGGHVSTVLFDKKPPTDIHSQTKIGDFWPVGDFASLFRQHREACALSQEDVARLLHISQEAYVNYEKGRNMPNTRRICELSRIFGVGVEEMGFKDIREGKRLLPERLRGQRKDRNWTCEQVADRLGVSKVTVHAYENGTCLPAAGRLLALSRLYYVKPDELLPGIVLEDGLQV